MEGPGGGQKLNLLRRYITNNNLPDHDVILFTDAYDVIYLRDLDTILRPLPWLQARSHFLC